MSTEEQRAKWRKAKQAQMEREGKPVKRKKMSSQTEAIVYLRHARTAIKHQVVSGQGTLDDPVYLFAMLALRALETSKEAT